MVVLVTGASGRLGRVLVPRLRERGHVVREGGRKGPVKLDLAAAIGVREAVADVDAIVHAASGAGSDPQAIDVRGTEALCAAAVDARVPHVVHLSIVGVDKLPTAYYRAKVAAEAAVEASGVSHTILRATQFHVFVDQILGRLRRFPLWTVPRGWQVQPIDEAAVADATVDCLTAGPSGRTPDIGGPDVLDAIDLARRWAAVRSTDRCIHAVPVPGAASRAMQEGALCCPDHRRGRSFADWLAAALPSR